MLSVAPRTFAPLPASRGPRLGCLGRRSLRTRGVEFSGIRRAQRFSSTGASWDRAGSGSSGRSVRASAGRHEAVHHGGVAEWFKAADLKSAVVGRLPGVRIPPPPPSISSESSEPPGADEGDENGAVCTSVCTPPPNEATLRAAIDRLTAALVTADDATIAGLVAERAQLRAELRARTDVVSLDEERARRGR
jgi:hypothetical protein